MKQTAGALWLSLVCCWGGMTHAAEAPNPVLVRHAADLVTLQGDKLAPLQSGALRPARYTVLYFSAGWCPDCRRFSPTFVEAYNHQPAGANRYEVLLVGRDKSAEGLLKYIKTEHMRWPALAFDKIAEAKDLGKYDSGRGIPCLTVIDNSGAVVLQSKSDQDANEVLKQLQQLVGTDGQK